MALFLVNADGTDPRQVTEFGALLGHELASAAWSPDGEQLISATSSGDLIEVRADGSGADTIDLDVGTDDYFAFAPSYSSDGSQIVFSLEVAAAADIYTADRNGSNVVQITDTEVPERFPSWANTPPPSNRRQAVAELAGVCHLPDVGWLQAQLHAVGAWRVRVQGRRSG